MMTVSWKGAIALAVTVALLTWLALAQLAPDPTRRALADSVAVLTTRSDSAAASARRHLARADSLAGANGQLLDRLNRARIALGRANAAPMPDSPIFTVQPAQRDSSMGSVAFPPDSTHFPAHQRVISALEGWAVRDSALTGRLDASDAVIRAGATVIDGQRGEIQTLRTTVSAALASRAALDSALAVSQRAIAHEIRAGRVSAIRTGLIGAGIGAAAVALYVGSRH